MASDGEDFQAKLRTALARRLGAAGEIHALHRLTGGAAKATWSFDAEIAGRRQALILQLVNPMAGHHDAPTIAVPNLSGEEDAATMTAARRQGVPAPNVRLVLDEADGLGTGFVTDRVEGEVLGRRILREPRYAVARQAMTRQVGEILAHIHAMDTAGLDFLITLQAAEEIAAYRALLDRYEHPQPAIEYAFRWLEERLPSAPRTTVVHGDFRTGNLIVDETGVVLVLDWEIAQLGDPMQDLGWICVRTWRFGGPLPVGGFGRREELFEAYEAAGGAPVDPDHVTFWEVFGSIKWCIMCMRFGWQHLLGRPQTLEHSAIGRRVEEPLYDVMRQIARGGV
ncbi:MAG: phosphotransferase family protein [Alphaproteobacteria bacterium]|nr:phosphotransferase family protein [Alphaproteobacteria bacterium]